MWCLYSWSSRLYSRTAIPHLLLQRPMIGDTRLRDTLMHVGWSASSCPTVPRLPLGAESLADVLLGFCDDALLWFCDTVSRTDDCSDLFLRVRLFADVLSPLSIIMMPRPQYPNSRENERQQLSQSTTNHTGERKRQRASRLLRRLIRQYDRVEGNVERSLKYGTEETRTSA